MKRLERALIGIALVGGLVISSAPLANAHVVPSFLSFGVSDRTVRRHQSIFFFGDLRTPGHRGCHRNALIILRRRHSGIVDTTHTDFQGNYVFKIDPKPNHGRYYARYRGRSDFGYQGSHGCLDDTSRIIHIRRR
jgi:hypothetical protein